MLVLFVCGLEAFKTGKRFFDKNTYPAPQTQTTRPLYAALTFYTVGGTWISTSKTLFGWPARVYLARLLVCACRKRRKRNPALSGTMLATSSTAFWWRFSSPLFSVSGSTFQTLMTCELWRFSQVLSGQKFLNGMALTSPKTNRRDLTNARVNNELVRW